MTAQNPAEMALEVLEYARQRVARRSTQETIEQDLEACQADLSACRDTRDALNALIRQLVADEELLRRALRVFTKSPIANQGEPHDPATDTG